MAANPISSTNEAFTERGLNKQTTLQSAAAATGSGTLATLTARKCSLVTRGTFSATIKVEISDDGINFVQLGSDITAAGHTAIETSAPFLRARVSAYTSGAVTVVLCE